MVESSYGNAVHRSASKANLASVLSLLSAKASPNAVDPSGDTVLHAAARTGSEPVVTALLKAGARPDVLGADGSTPLQCAAELGHASVIRAILAAGGAIEAKDAHGWTALYRASARGLAPAVKQLLACGAALDGPPGEASEEASEVQAASLSSMAAHQVPCFVSASSRHAAHGHLEATSLRLAAAGYRGRADLEGRERPLHVAAMLGHVAVVRLLLEGRASPHVCDRDGAQPLHAAATYDHPEVAVLLLEARAQPDAADAQGRTPLIWAAANGAVRALRQLVVEAGASVRARDAHGVSALTHAVQEEQEGAVRALLSLAPAQLLSGELAAARLVAVMHGHTQLAGLLEQSDEAGGAAPPAPLRIGGDAPIGLSEEEAAQLRRVTAALRSEASEEAEQERTGRDAAGPTPLQRAVLARDSPSVARLLRPMAHLFVRWRLELYSAWHLAAVLARGREGGRVEMALREAAWRSGVRSRWCDRCEWEGLSTADREAAWAEAAAHLGIHAPKVRLGYVWYARAGRRVRGLVAAAPISRGEVVLSVPAPAVFSDLALLGSPLRAFALAHIGTASTCSLLAVLALREGSASTSQWMPYVKGVLEPALAEAASLPCTWAEDSPRLQDLSDEGRRKAAALRSHLLAQHAALFPHAFDRFGAALSPDGGADRTALDQLYSAGRFVQMCAVLIARGIEKTVRATAALPDLACVPHFDLCNYAASPREGLHLRFDCLAYRVVCTAKEAIPEGGEILYHYGSKPAEDFLQNYGFVPDAEV